MNDSDEIRIKIINTCIVIWLRYRLLYGYTMVYNCAVMENSFYCGLLWNIYYLHNNMFVVLLNGQLYISPILGQDFLHINPTEDMYFKIIYINIMIL